MSMIIKRVSTAIASQHHAFIKFPNRDSDSLFSEKQKFMEIEGTRGVIGAIDCTHIKLFHLVVLICNLF